MGEWDFDWHEAQAACERESDRRYSAELTQRSGEIPNVDFQTAQKLCEEESDKKWAAELKLRQTSRGRGG